MSVNSRLNVIEGDYGLVSLDVNSIQSILYMKLCNIPVKIRVANSLKLCLIYNIPNFVYNTKTLDEFNNIISYLKSLVINIDDNLSLIQKSETMAYINFVTTNLKPAIEFQYWLDQRNFNEFTSRWFMKALPFPFNFSYIKKKKENATNLIETIYPSEDNMDLIREYFLKSLADCFTVLSNRLGKSDYFHGDITSSMDIVVYSYLAPILKIPFPSTHMYNLLIMCPNLCDFIKRIDAKYFPNITKDIKYLKKEEADNKADDEVSYLAVFILFVSATSLAFGFAVKQGIFKSTSG